MNDDEMLMSVGFADAHKLKIGDSVEINDKTFKIVGQPLFYCQMHARIFL